MTDNRSESSMEEILSSIKRIIAEDRTMPLKKPVAADDTRNDAHDEDDTILELTEPLANEAEPVKRKRPDPEQAERLIDDNKLAAMRESLTALAAMERVDARKPAAPAPVEGKTLEALVGEMLRPLLKDWLDENLPTIVEEMVAKEIQRISRE